MNTSVGLDVAERTRMVVTSRKGQRPITATLSIAGEHRLSNIDAVPEPGTEVPSTSHTTSDTTKTFHIDTSRSMTSRNGTNSISAFEKSAANSDIEDQTSTAAITTGSQISRPVTLSSFLYHVNVLLVGASIRAADHLFCKFGFVHGPDWSVLGGAVDSWTPVAARNRIHRPAAIIPDLMQEPNELLHPSARAQMITNVWNTQTQATYASSNVFGWPQMIFQVYTLDWTGKEAIQAYGHMHLPPIAGRHELSVRLFRPKNSTLWAQLSSRLLGKRPEFVDFRPVANGQGRDLLRFESETGLLWLQVDVMLKDFLKHGFVSS